MNFDEFRKSAIPAEAAQELFRWREGDSMLSLFIEAGMEQRRGMASLRPIPNAEERKALSRYKNAFDGGWIYWGASLQSADGICPVPCIKLANPRLAAKGFGEPLKPIKYEQPPKQPALPMLARYSRQSMEQIADENGLLAEFRDREFEEFDPLFWRWLKQARGEKPMKRPIVIGEGAKKNQSIAEKSYLAIGLRGVTCWHEKGDPSKLHGDIEALAVRGQHFAICFDRDEKPKTIANVSEQIDRLARQLEKRGCKISIVSWDKALGKGIDDVLFRVQSEQGEEAAQAWLDQAIANATPFRVWKRDRWVTEALGKLDRLNSLACPIERATEGEYLPQLPQLQPGAIHILDASMGSGKSVRIGEDWVKSAIAAGWRILAISPLNSLGEQSASNWDLPHIHAYGADKDSQAALWADVAYRGGIVLCPDSLHRLPAWLWERDGKPCPILLILDEANQAIDHLLRGQTLGNRWSDILGRFAAAARHAISHGAIVLSEDGIPDRAIDFTRSISSPDAPIRAFKHRKISAPWDAALYDGQASGFRRKLLEAIAQGRHLIATSSQAEARRLERAIGRKFPGKKVSRIDSETNESGAYRDFFTHPDRWLQAEQPDILIISPSAKSGISIEGGKSIENAYFDRVWGYFSCLASDTHWQLLGRYRPPVPREIYCPRFIQQSGDEGLLNARSISRRLALNSKAMERAFDFEAGDDERAARELEIEAAALQYISQSLAASGLQKSVAQDALLDRLESAGHSVSIEVSRLDRETSQLWKEIQEEIWREDAAFAAALEIDPGKHDKDWAIEQLNSMEASKEARTRAQKVLWRDAFPGIGFDEPEECYRAIYRDYGRMKRGAQMQAMAEMPDRTKESDRAATEAILRGNLRALHRLPKNYARSLLLSKLGVLELLDGTPYSNADSRAIAIKEQALRFAKEIGYWLDGIQIEPEQSPIEICHKLLRKFGLEIDRSDRAGAIETIARPGRRGEKRERIYRVDLDFDPFRSRLLEAARRKLSESVSTISNVEKSTIKIMDTKQTPPMNEELEGIAAMLAEFSAEGILDREAMLAITAPLSPIEKRKIWESLPPEIRDRLKAIAA
jgi:Domain of unknown function (DUF3854)